MTTTTISIQEMADLLKTTADATITRKDTKAEIWRWVEDTLVQIQYFHLGKKEKGVVIDYLAVFSGYTEDHIKYLIGKQKKEGHLRVQKRTQHSFPEKYTHDDVVLLAQLSEAYGHPNGHRIAKVCNDMRDVHHDERFVRLGDISGSHTYNIRKKQVFKNEARTFEKTKKTSVPIGKRQKPRPDGTPGYIRVDSVHQGDRDGEKGVYHITLVDEVTQWTVLMCVPVIAEKYMIPALKEAFSLFPFTLLNFHTDNGSEYINYAVQKVLKEMGITQTKGRSRQHNDNALVESKNNSVVRKHMGYIFIDKKHAKAVTVFYKEHFNDFLNFHYPCHFPEIIILPNGKRVIKYPDCMTPLQKLLSLPNAEQHLKDGVTKESLLKHCSEQNPFQVAKAMQKAKQQLFTSFSS